MNPIPEPKDGNRGRKKPTLPIELIDTAVRHTEACVFYVLTWKDALGELYTTSNAEFYYDMELVEPKGNISEG